VGKTGRGRLTKPQPTFAFRLVFSGASEITTEIENGLFEVGCDDATIHSSGGVVSVSFDREAPSFRIALLCAILDVERAGVGLELARVEPEDPL